MKLRNQLDLILSVDRETFSDGDVKRNNRTFLILIVLAGATLLVVSINGNWNDISPETPVLFATGLITSCLAFLFSREPRRIYRSLFLYCVLLLFSYLAFSVGPEQGALFCFFIFPPLILYLRGLLDGHDRWLDSAAI